MVTSGQPVLRTEWPTGGHSFHAPPLEWGVEVGLQWSFCSERSSTFQWLQSNPPPGMRSWSWAAVKFLQWVQFNFSVTAVKPRMRSWSWVAVSAVQLFSDCSQTPPLNQELKLGCSEVFAVSTVQLFSDCSQTQNEELKLGCSECSSTFQWLQSNPPPPPWIRSWSWAAVKFLQWVQFNFSVTAVEPPPLVPYRTATFEF